MFLEERQHLGKRQVGPRLPVVVQVCVENLDGFLGNGGRALLVGGHDDQGTVTGGNCLGREAGSHLGQKGAVAAVEQDSRRAGLHGAHERGQRVGAAVGRGKPLQLALLFHLKRKS